MFSDHYGIKLEISNNKIPRKPPVFKIKQHTTK